MSDSGGAQPRPVMNATEVLDSAEIALYITPDEVIALRKPPSMIPALLLTPLIALLMAPLLNSLHRELTRKGFTSYAKTLSILLGVLIIPLLVVPIAMIRRRRLERGIKIIDNMVTVLTPEESIAVTRFPIADLKDVSVVREPSFNLLETVCRLVIERHVGGKVNLFRGCRPDDLQRVAKALYPRIRARVKGFEVKTGEELKK
jgi:hypothetical protein